MPMEVKILETLRAKLGSEKITVDGKELPLLDGIVGWFDKAEAAVKIQQANTDLTTQREAHEKELKELKTAAVTHKEEVERLLKNQLSDEDKAKLEKVKTKGMTSEMEAIFNTQKAAIEAHAAKIAEMEKKTADAEVARVKAEQVATETAMRNDITTALANVKIVGESGRIAINTILADKMVSLNDKGERVYTVHRDGKPFSVTSMNDLVADFAKTHENLVSPSGNRGTGAPTGSPTNGAAGAGGGSSQGQSLREVQAEASAMLNTPSR